MYQELSVICTILTSERLPYILTPLLPGPSLNVFGPNVTWKCFKKSSQDLTYLFAILNFYTARKHQKIVRSFYVFKGYRNETL